MPRVASDARAAAGRLATRHLLEHGFDDVVAVTVPQEATPAGPRVQGWRDELAESAPHSSLTPLRTDFDR